MSFLSGSTSSSPHVTNLMSTISTFLAAHGWALFDTVSATDKVFKSTGTGRENIYVRLTKSTDRVLVRAYAFWNAGTNTGYNKAGADTDGVDGDDTNPFAYWLWTDGRAILVACKVGSTYNGAMAGALDRVADASIGTTTSDVAAGAGVSVALNQSFPTNPDWQVGKKLMVIDQSDVLAAGGAVPTELATVTAVAVGSVHLTLAAAHKGGAMVGVDPQPVFASGLNDVAATPRMTNDLLGWSSSSGRAYAQYVPFSDLSSAIGQSERTGRHLEVPLYIVNDSDAGTIEARGKVPGVLAFPDGGAGISAEGTTDVGGSAYVALPIGTGASMLLVPMF